MLFNVTLIVWIHIQCLINRKRKFPTHNRFGWGQYTMAIASDKIIVDLKVFALFWMTVQRDGRTNATIKHYELCTADPQTFWWANSLVLVGLRSVRSFSNVELRVIRLEPNWSPMTMTNDSTFAHTHTHKHTYTHTWASTG